MMCKKLLDVRFEYDMAVWISVLTWKVHRHFDSQTDEKYVWVYVEMSNIVPMTIFRDIMYRYIF